MMDPFTLGELSVAVVGVMGAAVVCVRQIQKSRCRTINLCFGCMKCEREVPPEDENASEKPDTSPAPSSATLSRS